MKKNKLILLALFLSLIVTAPSIAHAATATPAASPTTTDQTTQNLKDRIDKVIEQRRDQVKGVIDQLGERKRAFVGEVQRVSEKTVTIKSRNGTEILTISTDVALLKDNKRITIDDIAVGDWIIVMGYVRPEGFAPKRLVVTTAPVTSSDIQTILGTLTTSTKTQVSIAPRTGGDLATYILNKNTVYQDNLGQTADIKILQKDIQYLIIAQSGKTATEKPTAILVRALAPIQVTPSPRQATP